MMKMSMAEENCFAEKYVALGRKLTRCLADEQRRQKWTSCQDKRKRDRERVRAKCTGKMRRKSVRQQRDHSQADTDERKHTHTREEKMVENSFGLELLRITSADWIFIICDLFIRAASFFFSPLASRTSQCSKLAFLLCCRRVSVALSRLFVFWTMSVLDRCFLLVARLPGPTALAASRHLLVRLVQPHCLFAVYCAPFWDSVASFFNSIAHRSHIKQQISF